MKIEIIIPADWSWMAIRELVLYPLGKAERFVSRIWEEAGQIHFETQPA